MDSLFLSYSFNRTALDLLGAVESVLEQHDVRPVTGVQLEGRPLTAAIKEKIAESDGLVAILTPAAKIPRGGWQPTAWVLNELQHARSTSKPTIALKPSKVAALPGEYEYIELNFAAPHEALLKLSETISAWKRRGGRRAKVRLLPPSQQPLAAAIGQGAAQARYRLSRDDGRQMEVEEWKPAALRLEPGGIFAYLKDVRDDALIEMEVKLQEIRLRSVATPQWLHVEMKEEP